MDGAHAAEGRPGEAWQAPEAAGPVSARLRLPGSKSMTNRALVLAAISSGPAVIANPLRSRDTLLMAGALRSLGCEVTDGAPPGDGTGGHPAAGDGAAWHVTPGPPAGPVSIDVGNAGTVMRFVPPVAALTAVPVEFHGDPQASHRPVGPVLGALRELGAVIDDGGRGGIPFTVRGTGSLDGGVVTIDASASSQFVSGLLLAAPRYDKGVEVRHRGPRMPSAPHLAMTVQMLRDAGAEVETGSRQHGGGPGGGTSTGMGPIDTWRVQPGPIRPAGILVQPDVVNAMPFLAAALVTSGTVTIPGWPRQTCQPAAQILDLLTLAGAHCEVTGQGLTVTGTGTVRGVTADLADVPEIALVAGAVAALADGPSRLTGIGHIRKQETDRLAALATEIGALGGEVTELADGLEIRPVPLRAGRRPFATYDDHRMVMAAAVLGLAVPGLQVANASTVGKTFPGFTGMWAAMLAGTP